jgi:hypothetical protein
MNSSKHITRSGKILLILIMVITAVMAGACASKNEPSKGDELGEELTMDETYDHVHDGARLVLSHDAVSNSFNGFVENTSNETLMRVRVEVHLSNAVKLGPTTSVDLAPGESKAVRLLAKNSIFKTWSAHLEVAGSTGEDSEGKD